MPFINKNDEWGFLGAVPFFLGGGVVGGLAGGSWAIKANAKKYSESSAWYAFGGMILHYAVGAGLMYLLRSDQNAQAAVGYTVYLTAPISGTAAYLLLGKPKRASASHPAARP